VELERLEALVSGPLGTMAFPLLAETHRRAGRPEEAERVAREGLRRASPAPAGRIALALALLDQKRDDEARVELEGLLGGDAEHRIAREALVQAGAGPSIGLDTARVAEASAEASRGELATLDPYPQDERHSSSASDENPASGDGDALPGDEAPGMTMEPGLMGPFGPPPPPAPARSLVFDGEVEDDELEGAFAEAESERDQMLGADDVAQAVLASVPDEEDLGRAEADLDEEEADGFAASVASPSSPFATETVAGLLERQGHGDDAARVRAALATPHSDVPSTESAAASEPALELADEEPEAPQTPLTESWASPEPALELADEEPEAPQTPSASRPKPAQATLERWLDNLRRDRS
jgi:hypothetical protein